MEERPYKAGLGLPKAVVISSGHQIAIASPVASSSKYIFPHNYESYDDWKEWHINPSLHGPGSSKGPPRFVPAQNTYDEMGRSLIDGATVDVQLKRVIDSGEDVANWYRSLSHTPAATTPKSVTPETIDLTQDDEEPDRQAEPSKEAWFIRKALANSTTNNRPARPTTIGRLLETTSLPTPEPHYALGPENKGHQILKENLRWDGGGLGVARAHPEDSSSGNIGRTVPIATALKLDRLGLGHQNALRRQPVRVTHSHKDISAAQKRVNRGSHAHPGQKERIKWREKYREDVEQRKRTIADLNS